MLSQKSISLLQNPFRLKKIDNTFQLERFGGRIAEMKMALFIVEHNLPFMVADHMAKICQSSFPDSDNAKNMQLGRTKATAIVKNIIGKDQFMTLCELYDTL